MALCVGNAHAGGQNDNGFSSARRVGYYGSFSSSGRRFSSAAQSLFILRLLGFRKIRVYYGSFADYSALPNVPIDK
jgi:3-mercaptopyruvate sulfurtransferase SseA